MVLTYFKRYRMESELAGAPAATTPLPPGYRLLAWSPSLLAAHADAKYRSFCDEVDAHVFPCLGSAEGCRQLMVDISRRAGFLPAATWLVTYGSPGAPSVESCGTIQGIIDESGLGSIQNIGVTPGHRGKGVASRLIQQALAGFRDAGLSRAMLEVTAQNAAAIRLYQRLGFHRTRTLYKAVESAYA